MVVRTDALEELEELIPAARSGLEQVGVPDEDRDRYLDVIEERVASGRTGARWLLAEDAAQLAGLAAFLGHLASLRNQLLVEPLGDFVHPVPVGVVRTVHGGAMAGAPALVVPELPVDPVDLVVEVALGNHTRLVEIVPDALPDTQLFGTVEKIGQAFTTQAGDILYTVTISLEDSHPDLRWGMTVELTFLPE